MTRASIPEVAEALRRRDLSATELTSWALDRHDALDAEAGAYKVVAPDLALEMARRAEAMLERDDPPPLCGIPVSVKDLYGVDGLPTFAGTCRELPAVWSRDAWLVARLREQGAVFVGKTHTVELAFGAVGINPHWGTPKNPWDAGVHRIPGGSSCGAGVSLWEGSALIALGTDTGGSIRVPASMTGTVGQKLTHGRWPVDGVVPLSHTLDSVGALTRSVEDAVYVFGSLDPAWGEPALFAEHLRVAPERPFRLGLPACEIWRDCSADIAPVIHAAIAELERAGWSVRPTGGALLDRGRDLYLTGGIASSECRAFVERELPGWLDVLHPTVGTRLAGAPGPDSERYGRSIAAREELLRQVGALFEETDLLALPGAFLTPPPVAELGELDRYLEVNAAALGPTCPVNMLGLSAITIPCGLDEAGMPVGLQLVAPGGRDEDLLGAAFAAERVLGSASERLGDPPRLGH